MKLTTLFLTIALTHVSAAVFPQRVTLSGKNITLGKVFTAIKEQTGYVVFANKNDLIRTRTVSLAVSDMPLTELLHIVLRDQQVEFMIKDRTIILSGKKIPAGLPEWLMSIPVKGRLVGADGQPLAGVNIIVRGTTKGVTSTANGSFSIVVNEGDVLEISSVGFAPLALRLLDSTFRVEAAHPKEQHTSTGNDYSAILNPSPGTLVIRLVQNTTALSEVVVNKGYYSESRKLSTGNVSRVESKEIENQPVTNPLAALIGKMPGVSIQQRTGVPGGGFEVQIRGRNSLRDDGNNALYIVDGVPVPATSLSNGGVSGQIFSFAGASPFNTFNPSDIESIEVLKDADATAIYGSRGANGVILITTKKGKSGKTAFDVNVQQGMGRATNRMKLLSTRQYLEMRREAFYNDGFSDYLEDPQYDIYWPDIKKYDTTRYTDWQDYFFGGSAQTTNAQATISGGSVNTQFVLSGTYYQEGSVFPGSFKYKKVSTHFNLNHYSDNRKFNVSLTLNYVSDKNDLPKTDLTDIGVKRIPHGPPIYDENGKLNWSEGYNALAFYAEPEYNAKNKNFIASSLLAYNITDNFRIKANVGFTNMQLKDHQTNPISANNPALNVTTGYTAFGEGDVNTWIIEPQAEYKKNIGKGILMALVGTTFQESLQEGQTLFAQGFRDDNLMLNIKFATSIDIWSVTRTQYRYNAIYGRLNYNWEDKYLLNLTGRRDGSSRFGPGKQFANFGAVGAAWIFSEESFARQLGFLSFGKLRMSYGTTGNDQIGDYEFMDTYVATSYQYDGVVGLTPRKLVNPDYAWETSQKLEAGLELGFFSDRLFMGISTYRNRSSNQLVGFSLPVVTGFGSIQYNLPATVQNTGWEIEMSGMIIQKRPVTWRASLNFTFPNNKLIAFPNIEDYSNYKNRWIVGKSLNTTKRLHGTGVDPATGVYGFEDVDGNGSISFPDDTRHFTSGIRFYGGLENSLSYKAFQLGFSFQFMGKKIPGYLTLFSAPGTSQNYPVEVMSRWRKPGDITKIQKFTQSSSTPAGDAFSYANYSGDQFYEDASFVRLKNVSLSWSLPKTWAGRVKAGNARLYVLAQNLLTITQYQGLDPETGSLALSPLQVITAGVQLSF